MERPSNCSWTIGFLVIIIFLFRHFFKVPSFLQITTYQRDIWYIILKRQRLFDLENHALNHTPLWSYPPFYEKLCYRFFYETVRDIDLKPFVHCLLTRDQTLLHFSRIGLTTTYRSYFPLNIWYKFYISKTQEPEE